MSSNAPLLLLALLAQAPDLRLAARLDAEGKCAESEPIYQRALAAGVLSPALLNNAGNHYLACGDAAKAASYFEQLLRRVPSHPNANLQLAKLAAERKDTATAVRHLRVLTAADDPSLLSEIGAVYARLGDFKAAQHVFQRVAAARPGDWEALWNLGRAAARAGDLPRAREALEAALRIKPDDAGTLVELGLANAAAGDSPRAVFLLAQAESRMPGQPAITLALARAAEDAGYYGDALIAYDRYLNAQPGDDNARRDRARVLANTPGGRAQGLKALEEYVRARPQDPISHFQLAQLIWETHPEESLEHLAEALKLDPRLGPAHTARAWLLHRLGRDAEALPHLESALKLAPDDVRALDQYGLVLVALERAKEAEKAFRRAAALAPNDWEVRLHLGRALMEQGRAQEAQTWLDQYRKLRPPRQRDPRREPGMIQLATLSAPERRAREIERFQSMAKARPDDALLRLHLGSLLLAEGREAEARAAFESLLAGNADADTLARAGRALAAAGRHDWAVAFLDKAGTRTELALALFHVRGADAALQALAGETTEGALLLKARILDSVGRTAEAQQLLTAATAAASPQPEIAGQAALLLAKYGRLKEAAPMLARAVAAAPANRDLQLSEAVVHAISGRIAEAGQRLKNIESSWPEWAAPHLFHARMLAEAKRAAEADQKLRTADALGFAAKACRTVRDWLEESCRGAVR